MIQKETRMNKNVLTRKLAMSAMLFSLLIAPIASFAQTRVDAPQNKYPVSKDVEVGNQAAAEVDRRFPLVNDNDVQRYIERVGQNLVRAIPSQYQQPAFNYRFKVVDARDINAFALPGGPMYVNRGMIQAARNEGEMAGVMAHEISHVALRHATAQATKQGSAKNTLGTLALILGGAVAGGQTGAQLGALAAQAWQTKYSRGYETQADVLGARIMADAGYDPRDLANMFQTIGSQRQGAGAPEFLSSHPDPGGRFQKINQEAQYLNVSSNPIKITRDFERVKSRLASMPRARTMAEIERGGGANNGQVNNPTSRGRYSNRVGYPSNRTRVYNGVGSVSFNVPDNWREFGDANGVTFAPEGAYGDQGITHGALVGLYRSQNGGNLNQATDEYVQNVLSGNPYLQRRSDYSNVSINGRRGNAVQLAGRSPVTNRNEIATVYTTTLGSGDLLYFVTVVPEAESGTYNQAFRTLIGSVRFSDQY